MMIWKMTKQSRSAVHRGLLLLKFALLPSPSQSCFPSSVSIAQFPLVHPDLCCIRPSVLKKWCHSGIHSNEKSPSFLSTSIPSLTHPVHFCQSWHWQCQKYCRVRLRTTCFDKKPKAGKYERSTAMGLITSDVTVWKSLPRLTAGWHKWK